MFDEQVFVRRVSLLAIATLMLGLAACDRQPAVQPGRDSGGGAAQSSAPAAGTGSDAAGSGANGAQARQTVDDLALNIKVEDALKANPDLKGLPIKVRTTAGVVTLSGTANTVSNRDLAGQLASQVTGVKSVQNKLSVAGI